MLPVLYRGKLELASFTLGCIGLSRSTDVLHFLGSENTLWINLRWTLCVFQGWLIGKENIVDKEMTNSTPNSVNNWKHNGVVGEEDGANTFKINSLPQIVFLSILSYLDVKDLGRASCVSKYWYNSSLDPGLWRILKLQKRQQVNDEVLVRIANLGANVTFLDISECANVTGEGLVKSIEQCHLLLELSTVRCPAMTDECLAIIGQTCKNLKFIDISLCLVTNCGIQQLCEGCTKLERLTMDQCRSLTCESLASISRHCPRMKSISVEYNTKVEDAGVYNLVQGCLLLEKLHLNSCGVTSQAAVFISHYCANMTVLDLRCCKSLGDDVVNELTMGCKRLRALNLSLCFNVTDLSLKHIISNCSNLRSLYLVHCKITDGGLVRFSKCGCQLERLDISWCQDVSDDGVRTVLTGCPRLRHLGLVRCDKVSEQTVLELNKQYPDVFLSTVTTEMNRMCKKAGYLGLDKPGKDLFN